MVHYKKICVVTRDRATASKMRRMDLERSFKGSLVSYHVFEHGKKPPEFPCDLLIAAGGDGTLFYGLMGLRTSSHVLHVNLGRRGFLAELELRNLKRRVQDILAGKFLLERISKISASIGRDLVGEAVNEVVFTAETFKGVLEVGIEIGGFGSVNMLGSGVLIASPLGSTAFSMSAGGPALDNRVKAFVITPVLAKRPWIPIVVSDDRIIGIRKTGGKERASLILDGLVERELAEGAQVTVRKSNNFANLIRFGSSYLIRRVERALKE